MIPIPAIDLRGGQVVRLLQGDFKRETVYSDSPETVARELESAGAPRLHVVDLDGALSGRPANLSAVEAILKKIRVPLEVGGGIRGPEAISRYLQMGASWVILGTKACLDHGFLREALTEFKDKIIVGIDAKAGLVATDGWTRVTQTQASELALRAQEWGCRTLIYTDIARDGVLEGPNLSEIRRLSEAVTLEVIASGGVGTLKDLERLAGLGRPNIAGVIIGKALYEKKFTVAEALRACSPKG